MKLGASRLFYFYVFILPLVFTFNIGRAPFELPKFLLTAVASSLLFIFWVFDQYKSGTISIKWNKPLLIFAAFVVVNGLSFVSSKDSFLSLWGSAVTPADSLISLICIFILAFATLQYLGNGIELRKTIWAMCASAALIGLHGLLQYCGFNFSNFSAVNLSEGRAYSTLGLPGVFSVVMAVASFLVAALVLTATDKLRKFALLAVFFLLQTVLYFSGTRVPAVLNLLSVSAFVVYFFTKAEYRKASVYLGSAAIVAAVLSLGVLPSLVVKKSGAASIEKGYESRFVVWKSGLSSWQENKWLGSGPETFPIQQKMYEPVASNKYEYWAVTWSKAHNHLVQFLVCTGVFGLAVFLFYFFSVVRGGFQLMRRPSSEDHIYALALTAAAIFIFLANLTSFNYIPTEVYFFLFPVLASAYDSSRGKSEILLSTKSILTKVTLIAVLLFSIVLSFNSFCYFLSEVKLQNAYDAIKAGTKGPQVLELIEEPVRWFPDNAFLHCYKANVIFSLVLQERQHLAPEKLVPIVEVINESSQSCVDLAKNRYEPYDVRGKIFLELYLNQIIKDGQKSEESYLKFRQLAPNSPVSYFNIGLLRLAQNNAAEFVENMNKAIDLKEDFLPAYLQLVKHYVKTKDQQGLTETLSKLTATTFRSAEFVGLIKKISSECSAYPEWVQKLNDLYSKYEYLTLVRE